MPIRLYCATSGAAARRWTGGRWTGPAVASLPALGPLDLALHVGPHSGSSSPAVSAVWARVMITNATLQRTAIVLSLARKPANCWSRSGERPATVPWWLNVGYSAWRAKIQTMERKLGTIDWTIR